MMKLVVICFVVAVQQSVNAQQCGDLKSAVVSVDNTTAVQVDWSKKNNICQCKLASPQYGPGYVLTPGVGAHKFHKEAKIWNEARKACIAEGAHLAILNSRKEEEVLRKVFEAEYKNIAGSQTDLLAWLGVHNIFNNNDWVTVLDQPLNSLGYQGWYKGKECWGPQPDFADQNCGALIRTCGNMDNVWCDRPQAFFCEKPEIKY